MQTDITPEIIGSVVKYNFVYFRNLIIQKNSKITAYDVEKNVLDIGL